MRGNKKKIKISSREKTLIRLILQGVNSKFKEDKYYGKTNIWISDDQIELRKSSMSLIDGTCSFF